MATILEKIVATKRAEIAESKDRIPTHQLRAAVETAPPTRNFFDALADVDGVALIAEIKKASPSAGVICENFDPQQIAEIYSAHGASCLSVLTDPDYFKGSLEYLIQVRSKVNVPILRKDFILDEYQLLEARAAGADAVLLIAECLNDCELRSLYQATIDLKMSPLVEIYEKSNLNRVLEIGATLIGVNNRNLHDFSVNLDHVLDLRTDIPPECLVVGESGISTRQDVLRLQRGGVDAILVGETLMRSKDIGGAVDLLLGNRRP